MNFFKRKDHVIDLTERYEQLQKKKRKQAESPTITPTNSESDSPDAATSPFAFFANSTSETSTNSDSSTSTYGSNPDEKRKRLAKRLADMTSKSEDLSNQIYHLQQRIEVIEKKMGV